VAGDLQSRVLPLKLSQVGNTGGLRTCDEPVVDVAGLELVFEIMDGH